MDKRRYARAPAHWLVLNASQLNARHFWNRIGGGNSKDVYQTRLNTSAATPVVTKVGHYRWSDDRHKASEIVREMLYLEYLRGLPGVPLLLGAYHSGSGNNKTTTLVVRDSGGRRVITRGLHPYKKEHPSELYTKLAQEQPLALALAILSCFQSFAERGGCLLFDFTPRQFTVSHVNSTVRFELVDVPSVAAGPLYEALYHHEPTLVRRCNESSQCPMTKNYHACQFTTLNSSGVAAFCPWNCPGGWQSGAPEARGSCVLTGPSAVGASGSCEPINGLTHAYDVASKPWLLPFIAPHSKAVSSCADAARTR
jgi:hypothetical protein